jgi:hypothetical protein
MVPILSAKLSPAEFARSIEGFAATNGENSEFLQKDLNLFGKVMPPNSRHKPQDYYRILLADSFTGEAARITRQYFELP